MKYRIVEYKHADGHSEFYPQSKFVFMWDDLYSSYEHPTQDSRLPYCSSLEQAERSIKHHVNYRRERELAEKITGKHIHYCVEGEKHD